MSEERDCALLITLRECFGKQINRVTVGTFEQPNESIGAVRILLQGVLIKKLQVVCSVISESVVWGFVSSIWVIAWIPFLHSYFSEIIPSLQSRTSTLMNWLSPIKWGKRSAPVNAEMLRKISISKISKFYPIQWDSSSEFLSTFDPCTSAKWPYKDRIHSRISTGTSTGFP